ncbi:MAG: DUF1552 domain-containing protein [Proteobacteria bacterium]|nr:DUF1552 domain-containing protein [Pseudomonadota bacterium]
MQVAKSLRLSRRAVLRGAGVAAVLPFLESMAPRRARARGRGPARLCFIMVPNGVSLPEEKQYRQWRWFPEREGKQYELGQVLSPLRPFQQQLSILGGLSHPKSRELMGHIAGDTFLTAGDLRGSRYRNSISADQVAVRQLKHHTRYPFLALSADGGVGYKSRISTLSFDAKGQPIPSEHRHRIIFERYFSPNGRDSSEQRRRALAREHKIVDMLREDSARLRVRLGSRDRRKLDDYLGAVSQVEEQIKRNERWLDVPLKSYDSTGLNLDVNHNVDPQAYIRSMLDLMVMGYQTDLTRVMTYMVAREDGIGVGDQFPKLALGAKQGHHAISHDLSTGHWAQWGQYDRWLASHFAYFLERMQNAEDEHGSLLQHTLVLYGSPCSTTHNARNYPLILAGGSELGARHGAYTRFDERIPLSNLFVSMLAAAGVEVEAFADSTGTLPGLFG